MGSPSRLHTWLAAALLTVVLAIAGLGVVRFIEHRREVRLAVFEALGSSMELALYSEQSVESQKSRQALGKAAAQGSSLDRQARKMLEDGRTKRVFLVERGRKLESLGVSRPAKVWLDLPKAQDAGDTTTEKVLALVAKLDHQFAKQTPVAADVDSRELAWAEQRNNQTVMVGVWPLIANGEFLGVVGVEQTPTQQGSVLVVPAALLLLAWLGLFAMALWRKWERPWLTYAASGVLVLVAAMALLANQQQEVGRRTVLARDTIATRVANVAEWSRPEAVKDLDAKWSEIFGETPRHLETARTPAGALVVQETSAAAHDLSFDLTWPVALVLAVILALCAWGLNGASGVVWGLARMPGVYAYVAPAMVGMLVLVLVPFLMGVGLAFFNQDYEFVGLQNFDTILFPSGTSDTNFYFTLGVTVLWTFSNIFLHVGIGLFMALILVNPKVKWKGLFRVLLIVPWAVPNYITALIWRWMFTAKIGAINRILESLGIQGPDWFGQSFWANFGANLATNVWLGFPFMMVVSMGALQSIPAELYEAADVDGASRWQKFRNITLPLLKPALFPAIILGTIWTFNMFNVIYLVSRGGPDNQTNILITEAYRFFKELNQYGVAAAYCILIFVILLLYTVITNRVTKATKGAFE